LECEEVILKEIFEIDEKYLEIWEVFISSLRSHREKVEEKIISGRLDNIHEQLKKMVWHPYNASHELSDNIGSITGLFFEYNVQTFLVPYIKKHVPEVSIFYNSSVKHKNLGLPRDPDIYFEHHNIGVVVELKVSPKKGDIDYILELKEKYEKRGIHYFFLANYLSANRDRLIELSALKWISIFEVSKTKEKYLTHFNRYDDIFKEIAMCLNS